MHRQRFRRVLRACVFTASECLLLGWLVYGNVIFFSSESTDCSKTTPMLTYFMLAVLIIGYVHFLVYVCVIFIVLAVLFLRYKLKRRKLNNSVHILRNLTKTTYGQLPSPKGDDKECIICWAEYAESDEVVKLGCNAKHFFHTACIESWIKKGNNSCPMCREPVDRNFE